MTKIIFTHSYTKKARQFIKSHPTILKQYTKTLQLLEINPYHPSLCLHKLTGKNKNIYSVSINLAYRITLDFIIDKDTVIPLDIGSHGQVY